jgi:hypothetical protein
VPALGAVHPAVLTAQRFADVLAVAGTGAFVPYDKDRRWGPAKTEAVLTESILHRPGETLIPTLSRQGSGLLIDGTDQLSFPGKTTTPAGAGTGTGTA